MSHKGNPPPPVLNQSFKYTLVNILLSKYVTSLIYNSPLTVSSTLDVKVGDTSITVFTLHSYLPLAPLRPTMVSTLCPTHNPVYSTVPSEDITESTLRALYSTENKNNFISTLNFKKFYKEILPKSLSEI